MVAGFVPALEVSPLKPGSVWVISAVIKIGRTILSTSVAQKAIPKHSAFD